MKHCKKCFLLKDDASFHKDKTSKDGLYIYCKSCNIKDVLSWQKKNQGKVDKGWERWEKRHKKEYKALLDKWANEHPEYVKKWAKKHKKEQSLYGKQYFKLNGKTNWHRYVNSKSCAKHRKKYWNISFLEYNYLISQTCFYCEKITLDKETGIGLDRIDNNKGYILDNVLPCCGKCNFIRCNKLTIAETKVVVGALMLYNKMKGEK